jgi:hypothetical protein
MDWQSAATHSCQVRLECQLTVMYWHLLVLYCLGLAFGTCLQDGVCLLHKKPWYSSHPVLTALCVWVCVVLVVWGGGGGGCRYNGFFTADRYHPHQANAAYFLLCTHLPQRVHLD